MIKADKATLKELVTRILAAAEPKKIVLFGSGAASKKHIVGDIDVLVLVAGGSHRRKTAQSIYRNLIGFGLPVDVVVVTEDDVKEFADNTSLVLYPALNEGKVIYAA
jgi:predicted nucleotidyltransferase